MKFSEAMAALESGQKVRVKQWPEINWLSVQGYSDGTSLADLNVLSALPCEWELYQECAPTLSFLEMVRGLKKGKRFTRKEWEKNQVIECPSDHSIHMDKYGQIVDCNGGCIFAKIEDFEATDWVEVKR